MYSYKCEDCGKILKLKERIRVLGNRNAHIKLNYTYQNGSNSYCFGKFHPYIDKVVDMYNYKCEECERIITSKNRLQVPFYNSHNQEITELLGYHFGEPMYRGLSFTCNGKFHRDYSSINIQFKGKDFTRAK